MRQGCGIRRLRAACSAEQFDLQLGSEIVVGFQVHEQIRDAGVPFEQLGD